MKMPFSNDTFNAVFAIEATCHAPDVFDCYKEIGVGDQSHMFGYATDDIPELMPLNHVLATKLGARLSKVCKNGTYPWLRPNDKTQVIVKYHNDGDAMVPIRVHTVLTSTQHDEIVTNDEKTI